MLFLDTSALIKRYVREDGTEAVLERMEADPLWAVSAVARPETEVSLCRLGFEPAASAAFQRLQDDWQRCLVVPVDLPCLDRAADLGCRYQIRTLDALHLAAADRLPPPLTILTFDRRLARAARSMRFAVEGA